MELFRTIYTLELSLELSTISLFLQNWISYFIIALSLHKQLEEIIVQRKELKLLDNKSYLSVSWSRSMIMEYTFLMSFKTCRLAIGVNEFFTLPEYKKVQVYLKYILLFGTPKLSSSLYNVYSFRMLVCDKKGIETNIII